MIHGIESSVKIQSHHRERHAIVYVRQSSMRQVEHNFESKDMQYRLVQRAHTLGWRDHLVTVIDDDLGKSGASSTERAGFKSLVAQVGLKQVGIILVTDVSRLARNCADWYQLLDLAAFFGTLIDDAGVINDPRLYDDRLLLGMKGTFAEAQWFGMRSQLWAARLNKARRGELIWHLPVGYEHLPDGAIAMTPDEDVRSAIALVLAQFERLNSAQQVLRHLRTHALQMPHSHGNGALREVIWEKPSIHRVYAILKQPAYAGAYAYGKRRTSRTPGGAGKVIQQTVPMADWPVLIYDHFDAYISWEQFMRNQQKLRANIQRSPAPGAPRHGSALLAGLVICARCGRQMHVHYTHSPAYICDMAKRTHDEPRCQRFTLEHVDTAVVDALLQVLQGTHIELAIAAAADIDTQRQTLAAHGLLRLERAKYDVNLARRRYEKVDPDKRFVIRSLEQLWEEKLAVLDSLQREWDQIQTAASAPLSAADLDRIRLLAQDVPALWHAPATSPEDRKRLLRCLIRDVTLDSDSLPGFSLIHIRWITDATTTLTVARPKGRRTRTPDPLKERIRLLASTLPNDQIADILNAEGIRMTGNTGPWTQRRVQNFRAKHRIRSGFRRFSRASDKAHPVTHSATCLPIEVSYV